MISWRIGGEMYDKMGGLLGGGMDGKMSGYMGRAMSWEINGGMEWVERRVEGWVDV